MPSYKTHLTVLEQCATQYAQSPAFRIPEIDTSNNQIIQWQTVTFSQFNADVQHFAKYWTSRLSRDGVSPRSVVGLWYVHLLLVSCTPSLISSVFEGSVE